MTDATANAISAYSTLAIALLTAAYVGVSTCMLLKIRDQVRIAQSAADASKKSADTAVSAERAWIDITCEKVKGYESQFHFVVSNHGKTPAFNITLKADLRRWLKIKPGEPAYSDLMTKPVQTTLDTSLAANKAEPIYTFEPERELGEGMLRILGMYEVVLQGAVTYKNVVGELDGATTFCFRLEKGMFDRMTQHTVFK